MPRLPVPKGVPQDPGGLRHQRRIRGELTPQQKAFCREYVVDFNKMAAWIRAGYSARSARQDSYRLFNKPHIQAEIARLQEERGKKHELTISEVVSNLHKIAEDAQSEGKYAAAIRAFELLGKHLGMFIDKTEVNLKHEINQDPAALEREIQRLVDVAFGTPVATKENNDAAQSDPK